MSDTPFPWDQVDATSFVDPSLVDTSSGSFPVGDVGGVGNLGLAGTDTASGTVMDPVTFDWTNMDLGGGQTLLADGSQVTTDAATGNQSWTSADGTTYPDVNVSPDGSTVQFSDGSILDVATGNTYDSTGDLLFDPAAAAGSGNNGAGTANAPGAGSLVNRIAQFGSNIVQPKPLQVGGSSAQQNQQASSIGRLLSSAGSSIASLLGGTATKRPVNQQTVGQVGAANLGGSTGFMTLLVIGGFGFLLVLTMKGN